MISIDVLAQLLPNPLTMLVQLCSTLILFLLMKKFLWKSVKNFLDVRSEKMQADLKESEDAKAEALQDRQKALEQLNEASDKAQDIVAAAVQQAKDEKNAILARAAQEANAERKKAHEQIEAERQSMYRDMHREMVEVALTAAGKLIGEKDPEALDRDAVNAFVQEAGSHGQ